MVNRPDNRNVVALQGLIGVLQCIKAFNLQGDMMQTNVIEIEATAVLPEKKAGAPRRKARASAPARKAPRRR